MTKVFPWFVHAQSHWDVQACRIMPVEHKHYAWFSVALHAHIFDWAKYIVIRFRYEMPEEAPSANLEAEQA